MNLATKELARQAATTPERVGRIRELGILAPETGGPVVFRDGDYYGRTVIVAARVTDQIAPGEIVLTGDAVGRAGSGDLSFQPLGPVTLKGVSDPVSLFRAGRASTGS